MLEFMGCEHIPSTEKELDILLNAAKREEPELYKTAFQIIVEKRMPTEEEKAAQPKAIELRELVKIIEDKIDGYETEAFERITEDFIDKTGQVVQQIHTGNEIFKNEIKKQFDESIEQARKEFIKVEYVVKTSDSKENKIEGPVPEVFQDILELADERVNILLVGPAGCGKTHTAIQVAKALNMPFASQSCSAGMSESIFSGWLLPIGNNGKFAHVTVEFLKLYENGGVFLFDEIDGSDSNTLLFLNQALANKEFYLPQRFDNPRVVRHKDFVAIAAANTYGTGATAMYSGRNALDAATMDRFRCGIVPMDYSSVVESALINPELLIWGRAVRDCIKRHKMRKIMSTRLLLDGTKMMARKQWPISKIENSYFSDWSQEEIKLIEQNSFFVKRRTQESLDQMAKATKPTTPFKDEKVYDDATSTWIERK